jgi:hypothetical protein
MPNDTAVNSTVVNDLDNFFVTIHVTGLRQHKNLRRSFCTLKVSRSNLGETMRRINRMGGKIVDVTFSSQYEVEEDFVSPEIAIDHYASFQENHLQNSPTESKTIVEEDLPQETTAPIENEITPTVEEITAPIENEITQTVEEITAPIENEITQTVEEITAPIENEITQTVEEITAPIENEITPTVEETAKLEDHLEDHTANIVNSKALNGQSFIKPNSTENESENLKEKGKKVLSHKTKKSGWKSKRK